MTSCRMSSATSRSDTRRAMNASNGARISLQTPSRSGWSAWPSVITDSHSLARCRRRSSPTSPRRRSRSPPPPPNSTRARLTRSAPRPRRAAPAPTRLRRSAADSRATSYGWRGQRRRARRRRGRRMASMIRSRRRLGVLLSAVHPDTAGDLVAAAVGARLRSAGALPQLQRDVGAVDADRRGGHEAPGSRLLLGGNMHLVDLDLDPGGSEHVGHHGQRLAKAAVGAAAPRALGQVEEQEVDSQLLPHTLRIGRSHRLDAHLGIPSSEVTLPPMKTRVAGVGRIAIGRSLGMPIRARVRCVHRQAMPSSRRWAAARTARDQQPHRS